MEIQTNYVVSDSGVRVWKSPMVHPVLQHTNINHPDFLRKASETYAKGLVRGLPKICSENSEDARTWFQFSPTKLSLEKSILRSCKIFKHPGFTFGMARKLPH
jgi:hypothetical protein